MSNEAAPATGDPLESIKRVTSAEADVEAKVARLRESIEGQLEALQRETESALLQARTGAEREREATLAAARVEGDREAVKIVAEGTARAGTLRGKTPAELARRKEAVLSAILDEFRAPEKGPRT